MPICCDLIKSPHLAKPCDLRKFYFLHHEGRQIITGWFQRAWDLRERADAEPFEPFIYAWIAFNGWADCITDAESDQDMIKALSLNEEITMKFDSIVAQSSHLLSNEAKLFRQTWPVFKAQDLRRKNLLRHSSLFSERHDLISQYLAANIAHEPKCWKRHQSEEDGVPLDWPHTLAVLYRVRCNLFHGEKTLNSEIDRMIVSKAFWVLAGFLSESGFLN